MVGRSKRKIIKIGDSKGITLPPEWLKEKKPEEVHIFFDNLLIVFDDKQKAEDFAEMYIEKMTGVKIASELKQ